MFTLDRVYWCNPLKAIEFLKISNSSVTFIVFIVTASGFFANPSSFSHLAVLIPLLVSGYLMSVSAVIFNNIYDRDIDGEMTRTSFRIPLMNENKSKLTYIAISSLIAGIAIIFLLVNYVSAAFMTLGFLSYTVLYTMVLKRRTSLNIIIGGIAGSFSVLSGWMAPSVLFGPLPFLIAVFVFAWMCMHFLICSLVHNSDYLNTKIPMLPVKRGVQTAIRVITLNAGVVFVLSIIPLLMRTGFFFDVYLAVTIVMGAIMAFYILRINMKKLYSQSTVPLLNYSVIYLIVILFSFGIIRIMGR